MRLSALLLTAPAALLAVAAGPAEARWGGVDMRACVEELRYEYGVEDVARADAKRLGNGKLLVIGRAVVWRGPTLTFRCLARDGRVEHLEVDRHHRRGDRHRGRVGEHRFDDRTLRRPRDGFSGPSRYSPGAGVVCDRVQRACFTRRGHSPYWTDVEFGGK